jgi:threonine dehydrogenase-like Zn-dependent dehydrogenase
MKAIWLENGHLSLRTDLPEPVPPSGEALIKVRLAGICGTDIELTRGYRSFKGIPGHEFVGEVVHAPDDASWVGKRVVGEINAACGSCPTCLAGRPSHCEHRSVLGIADRAGVFAQFTTLPIKNLHIVPDNVSDEMAVFTEPLAAALEIQEQVQIKPTDRVLVIGAGRFGQLIGQTLLMSGCQLQVLVRNPDQKAILQNRKVPTISVDEVLPAGYDVVVEVSGSPEMFAVARKAIRPRGVVVMKSTYQGDLTIDMSSIVVDEITLIGSRCGPFAPALRLLKAGLVDPLPLIDARFSLDDGLAAMEFAACPGVLKVLLLIG